MNQNEVLGNIKLKSIDLNSIELIDDSDTLDKAAIVIIFIIRVIKKHIKTNDVKGFIEDIKDSGVSVDTLCSLYDFLEAINGDIEITFKPSGLKSELSECSDVLKQEYKGFLESVIVEC